jgi:hypothetical protein
MENLKAEQRAVMLILIHQTAGAIRQARNIQQRMRQRIELLIIEFRALCRPLNPTCQRISTRR